MKYYISDTHWGHGENIIRFDNRPFNSSEEMNQALFYNWNKTVTNADNVYILGDLIWSKDPDDWNRLLVKLKGKKHLILGNHDEEMLKIGKTSSILSLVEHNFELITNQLEVYDGSVEKYIIMSHYPILAYKKSYTPRYMMFHGHTHNNTMEQQMIYDTVKSIREGSINSYGNIFNVGCMMPYMNFTPRTAKHIYDRGKNYYKDEANLSWRPEE